MQTGRDILRIVSGVSSFSPSDTGTVCFAENTANVLTASFVPTAAFYPVF